jgi:uncharacterized protein (TIGR04141 family)
VDAEKRRVTLSLNAFLLRPRVTPVTAVSEASAEHLDIFLGTGSRSLRRGAQDPRFGLLVVLNLLTEQADPGDTGSGPVSRSRGPRMRELRYRSPAPYVQQTGHRAARDIPLDGFRIDRSTDLVAAIGSTGAVADLDASTLLGGRSLKFRTRIGAIEDLVQLAAKALAKSKLDRYRDEFVWVDNITLVEDDATIHRLRTHLAEILATNPHSTSVDAILPDDLLDVGDDRSISAIAFPNERGAGHGRRTLTVARIGKHVAVYPNPGERYRALDANLRFYDESDKLIDSASILECLSAEFQLDDAQYIAYDGDFFLVNGDYVQRIDRDIAQIPESQVAFPVYRGETEPAYNAKIGSDHKDEFICLSFPFPVSVGNGKDIEKVQPRC